MPAVVTFNVASPTDGYFIEEIDTGEDNTLDLVEVYSEWKVWSLLGDNLKYPPAFRQVGADPITDTQNLGTTFFLNTGGGWRIRPAERDHLLQLNGNLFTDPPGGNPVAPTVGDYTVIVRSFVSNLVNASEAATLSAVAGSVTTIQVDVSAIRLDAAAARKTQTNRAEISFLTTPPRLIIYDDDAITPLYQFNLTTEGGEVVAAQIGIQTKRNPV